MHGAGQRVKATNATLAINGHGHGHGHGGAFSAHANINDMGKVKHSNTI